MNPIRPGWLTSGFVGAAVILASAALSYSQIPDGSVLRGTPDKVSADLTYPLDLGKLGIKLPRIISDPRMDHILHSPRTIFYKLPQVFQQYVPARRVEHKDLTLGGSNYSITRAVWGVYKTSFRPEFNANLDFPWETTVGLNMSHKQGNSPYGTVNFLYLPQDMDGRTKPILLLTDEPPVQWVFPPGTVIGEIIYVQYKGEKYVQEVRTRTRNVDNKRWFAGVFRPVKDRYEYQYLTGMSYQPHKRYMSFRNPEEDEVMRLEGTVEKLPDLSEEMVKRLLALPFKDVTVPNWSPAPDQEFHILPKDYSFALVGDASSESCTRCHNQTQISVRNLIPREPLIVSNPLKVGNIRGCDSVFTWHPFAMRSVAEDDSKPLQGELYYRNFDHINGVVRIVHRDQPAPEDYKITLFVQKALKSYELPDKRFLHDAINCEGYPTDGLTEVDRKFSKKITVIPDVPGGGVQQQKKEEPKPKSPVKETPPKDMSPPVVQPSSLVWVYRQDLDPRVFVRNILVDSTTGRAVGAYDPNAQSYRPIINGGLGQPSPSPVVIPDIVKSRR